MDTLRLLCLMGIMMGVNACGSDRRERVETTIDDPNNSISWRTTRVAVNKYCTPCHSNFRDAETFSGSDAENRIKSGTMPPSGKLPKAPKELMLSYLRTH